MNRQEKIIFYRNAAWNTIDALGSQTLVVVHHLLLQKYAGPQLHGIIGTIFSLLYMFVLIANMGFDFSCAPFIAYFTADKIRWRSFIKTKFIPHVVWIMSCCCVAGILVAYTVQLSDKSAWVIPAVLALTAFNESIKKTTKVFLQLLFYTPYTALIESLGMVVYAVSVWGWYIAGNGISILSSFFILYCVSLIQMLCFIALTLRAYYASPANAHIVEPHNLQKRIIRSRFWISVQRIIDQVFSNNFLVPFFAVACGASYASYFKIISSIARWVSLLGEKSFGITSLMLLAKDPSRSATIIPFINRIVLIVVLILAPILLMITTTLGYYCSIQSVQLVLLCSLLIMLRFIDMACVSYERWLLVHEKMQYSVFFTVITSISVGIGIVYLQSPISVMLILMTTRAVQLAWYAGLFKRLRQSEY